MPREAGQERAHNVDRGMTYVWGSCWSSIMDAFRSEYKLKLERRKRKRKVSCFLYMYNGVLYNAKA